MAKLVRFRVLDGIAVVTLDAAPVNALSAPLRAGLWEAFERIDANPDITAAVLTATGKMFSAGTDIRALADSPSQPSLPQLCDRIEACTKPVVAAVQGQALGGGAEILLAAHYRIAAPIARIGLPEVSLGLVPGAGGTQRLPRLVGAERALQMILSTSSVDMLTAHQIGLVDGVAQGDLTSAAISFANHLVKEGQGARPTRAKRTHLADGRAYQKAVAKARAAFANNPLHAPQRAIECVEAVPVLPFDAGIAFEEDAFARCLNHPQSIALRHVFVAERKIDAALIARDGAAFNPVDPMGKSVVSRLRAAWVAAGEVLVTQGTPKDRIDEAMVAYGVRRGPFGGKEAGARDAAIAQRLIAALLVQGATCVEEGAVQRPSDIDALAVHGMGFARRKGGPMRAAQSMGLIGLRAKMRVWAEESDLWSVPTLMDEAIKDARGFDALSQ